jgi:hypothetical protein
VEHRISPCTQICKSMQSPECGNVTHPKFPQFSSVDACVESCANPELENWWGGPQEDGEDACLDDWNAYASCVAALACEQQYEHWNASRVSDYPCKAEQDSQVLCGQSHPIPEAG